MELSVLVYRVTDEFPENEKYGLISQMRRCSVSIPSNIAEGYGRQKTQSFIQFLRISQGSLKELETQVELSNRIGILAEGIYRQMLQECAEIGKMLNALIRKLGNNT